MRRSSGGYQGNRHGGARRRFESADSRRSKLDAHIETEVRGVKGMVMNHEKAG